MKTKAVVLLLFYLITVGLYFYFSRLPIDYHLMAPWDSQVPTIPIFIVPYLFATFMFLAFPLFLFLKAKTEIFIGYITTQTIASFISYTIFALFPTSVVRSPITQNSFFADMLRTLHANDGPGAAFPSGHVFQSIIIGYYLWVYFPDSKPYVIIILPLIIASTVLLKQHYLPDILGGIIVAIVAIHLGKILYSKLAFLHI